MNNDVADEAYANGYRPPISKSKYRSNKRREKQQKDGREPARPSPSYADNSASGSAQGIVATTQKAEGLLELDTPSSQQKSPDSWNGITNPKTFNIYYGHWKDNVHQDDGDRIYPVMILGWDRQNGSGLKDTDLNDTGLLKKNSQPPSCYVYNANKIVGWAPGYEDDGPKIRSRKFPVMFFDESQTVAWLPARNLMKFPLYKRKAPDQPDHPFNAARRWIAEREGFKTWEDRERARIRSFTAHPPSPSPLTPIEDSSNMTSHAGVRDRPLATAKPDLPVDSDDLESSGSEAEATSMSTADSEKLIEDWREKAGEITGDDDYCTSDSDIDDTLDCEIEEWNRSFMSTARPDNSTTNRPWAFYDLRSTETTKEPKLPVASAHGTQESCLDSRETLGTSAESKEDAPNAMRDPGQSERPSSGDEAISGGARIEHDELVETIKRTLGFFAQDQFSSAPAEFRRPTSQRSESRSWHAVPYQPASGDRVTGVSRTRSVGLPPPKGNIGADGEGQSIDRHSLIQNRQATTTQKENEPSQYNEEYADEGAEHKGNSLPKIKMGFASTESLTAMNVPTPVASPSGGSVDTEFPPVKSDFELSLYSKGEVSWERMNEQESCIQLFHSADRKVIASRRGPVKVTINPMEIFGFSREKLKSSNKILFVLKNRDGSSSRLIFDRSRGSKLENGLVQARGFIKWLRDVNPVVDCLEP
ncbi:hypothetical protein F5Y13DRAFT_148688 [Hypoxylon sp. FL1857]|nr:hypothetical protein F5Y13DRAFT_148688 [Hypoxylon sp. FL1857]